AVKMILFIISLTLFYNRVCAGASPESCNASSSRHPAAGTERFATFDCEHYGGLLRQAKLELREHRFRWSSVLPEVGFPTELIANANHSDLGQNLQDSGNAATPQGTREAAQLPLATTNGYFRPFHRLFAYEIERSKSSTELSFLLTAPIRTAVEAETARAVVQWSEADAVVFYSTGKELWLERPERRQAFASESELLAYLAKGREPKQLLVITLGKSHTWSNPMQTLEGFWQECKNIGFKRVIIHGASAMGRSILHE
ncbi:MAG: hypothetical protein V4710_15135, partial [Verrucomicrobiota bacterium]